MLTKSTQKLAGSRINGRKKSKSVEYRVVTEAAKSLGRRELDVIAVQMTKLPELSLQHRLGGF